MYLYLIDISILVSKQNTEMAKRIDLMDSRNNENQYKLHNFEENSMHYRLHLYQFYYKPAHVRKKLKNCQKGAYF